MTAPPDLATGGVGVHDCLSCSGKGETYYICENRMLRCNPCRGTGKVERDPAWLEAGQKMRAERIAAGLSLREQATRLGLSVVDLGAAERGRIALPAPPEPSR